MPDVDPHNPWLGLSSFSEATSEFFFGRTAEIRELHLRVQHRALTIVYGNSGLGKTSLLQAGLIPQLREDGLVPVTIRFDFPSLDPEASEPPKESELASQVFGAIAEALEREGHAASAKLCQEYGGELWSLFHDESIPLHGPDAPRLVLIFDQFEEVFTKGERTPDAVASVISQIAGLVENRPSVKLARQIDHDEAFDTHFDFDVQPVKLVIILREDFLSKLERNRREMPSMMDNRMELRPLNGQQALEAVLGPARLHSPAHPLVDPAVGEALVRAVADVGEDVELEKITAVPPLLSLMCRELNSRRIAAGMDTIEASLLEGNSALILRNFYRSCIKGMPRAVRVLIEDRMLSPDGLRESVSRNTVIEELRAGQVEDPAQVIAELVNRRLVNEEERRGVNRLELTHDVLCDVVVQSRSERVEEETLHAAEEERIRQQRLRARSRRIAIAMGILAVLAAGGAIFGWVNYGKIQRAVGDLASLRSEITDRESDAERLQYAIADLSQAREASKVEKERVEKDLKQAQVELTERQQAFDEAGKKLAAMETLLDDTSTKLEQESRRVHEVLAFLQSERVHEELSKRQPNGLAIVDQIKDRISILFPEITESAPYLRRDVELFHQLGEKSIRERAYTLDVARQHFDNQLKSLQMLIQKDKDGGEGAEKPSRDSMLTDVRLRIAEVLVAQGRPGDALVELALLFAVTPETVQAASPEWPMDDAAMPRSGAQEVMARLLTAEALARQGNSPRADQEIKTAWLQLSRLPPPSNSDSDSKKERARLAIRLARAQLEVARNRNPIAVDWDRSILDPALALLWNTPEGKTTVVDLCLRLSRHHLDRGRADEALSLKNIDPPKELSDESSGSGSVGTDLPIEKTDARETAEQSIQVLALDRVIDAAIEISESLGDSVLAQLNLARAWKLRASVANLDRPDSGGDNKASAGRQESLPFLESAHRILAGLKESDPSRFEVVRLFSEVSLSLGRARAKEGNHQAAEDHFRQALLFEKEVSRAGGVAMFSTSAREAIEISLVESTLHNFYNVMGRGSPLEESNYYDDEVDYLGEGRQSRRVILTEMVRYRKVWPIQLWDIEAVDAITKTGDNQFTSEVSIRYWVSKDVPFSGKWDGRRRSTIVTRLSEDLHLFITSLRVTK